MGMHRQPAPAFPNSEVWYLGGFRLRYSIGRSRVLQPSRSHCLTEDE